MIKRLLAAAMLVLLVLTVITPTNAIYMKSLSFQSGTITAETIETAPPAPVYESIAEIKNELQVSSGTISTNTFVTNGPIKVSLFSGSITGALTTKRGVSISGSSSIDGPIYRQDISFTPQLFDYSIVPSNLPNRGDFSTSKSSVINSSGEYYNINISTPLTIDTTKNDVFIVVNHLNASDDINVIGNHRAVLIVKSNLNVNGHRSINYDSNHSNFDFVVKAWSLSLQNHIQFKGRLYFEGKYLYIRNEIDLVGAVLAPNAYVELSASRLYGALNCESLTLQQKALIVAK